MQDQFIHILAEQPYECNYGMARHARLTKDVIVCLLGEFVDPASIASRIAQDFLDIHFKDEYKKVAFDPQPVTGSIYAVRYISKRECEF